MATSKSSYCFEEKTDFKMEDFTVLEELGEGSGGNVSKCVEKGTSKIIALKKVQLVEHDGIRWDDLFEVECKVHVQLDHLNIVKMFGFFKSDPDGYIILEHMEMDLEKYISLSESGLPSDVAKVIGVQILKGLEYLHDKLVMHRDIKPSNVLMNDPECVKLADFGMARCMKTNPNARLTNPVTTYPYRAPEIIISDPNYSFAVDLWSFGCLFSEMLTKKRLFTARGSISVLCEIIDVLGTPSDDQLPLYLNSVTGRMLGQKEATTTIEDMLPQLESNPLALDVIKATIKFRPGERPTASGLLQFEFFKQT